MSVPEEEKTLSQVAALFEKMGAPRAQARGMAGQLIKRAEQLGKEREISKVEALQNLLKQVIEARQGP